MQFNYSNRISKKTTIKSTMLKLLLFVVVFFISLFLLSKFNFPSPKQEIKKNITNEIIKLK